MQSMSRFRIRQKNIAPLGLALTIIFIGVIVNEWFIARLFTVDGAIENETVLWMIRAFQCCTLVCGSLLFIFRRYVTGRDIGLALASIVISLLLIESGFRVLNPSLTTEVTRGWGPTDVFMFPKPYIMFSQNPQIPGVNIYGYKGKAPALHKGAQEYRIFVVGGSTVYFGEPAIPELLEVKIRNAGYQSVHVYNWGVVASNSSQDLARIVYEITNFEPDLIIVYSGGNDLFLPFEYDPRPGYPLNFLVYEHNPLLRTSNVGFGVKVVSSSATFRYLVTRIDKEFFMGRYVPLFETRKRVGLGTQPWRQSIADIYWENIEKGEKIANAYNADYLAFFQPVVYYDESQGEYVGGGDTLDGRAEASQHFSKTRKLIVGHDKKSNADYFFDISEVYYGHKEAYVDFIHTKQQWKHIVVDSIAGQVLNKMEQIMQAKNATSLSSN